MTHPWVVGFVDILSNDWEQVKDQNQERKLAWKRNVVLKAVLGFIHL